MIRTAALSLVALLLAVALSLAMAAYVNRALEDTYAGIVGTVAQKYPQAEAQVVQDLSSPDVASVGLGRQVMARYGLGDLSDAAEGVAPGLLARLLPAGLALIGLACGGFVFLMAGTAAGVAFRADSASQGGVRGLQRRHGSPSAGFDGSKDARSSNSVRR